MRPLLRLSAMAFSALALTGCATMAVGSYVQRNLDFTRYHSYDWGPADALPTGDARLDRNPEFKDRVEGAVERQLAARGYARSTSGTPDLLVHYHASVTNRIDVNRLDRDNGYCFDEDCSVRVFDYEAGTLIVDIVDAKTDRVVWRGWAEDTIDALLGDADRMAGKINDGVKRMFERLPRTL